MRDKWQPRHLGSRWFAAPLDAERLADLSVRYRHVPHGDVLTERRRKRPAGQAANRSIGIQNGEAGPRNAAGGDLQSDEPAADAPRFDLRQRLAADETRLGQIDHPA